MSFERIRAIADAVVLEDDVLNPYRASSTESPCRWPYGALAPRAWSEGPQGCEPWWNRTECLVEGDDESTLHGRLRFLHLERRRVLQRNAEGAWVDVGSLEAGGELHMTSDEGHIEEVELERIPLATLVEGARSTTFRVSASRRVQLLENEHGEVVGRVVRERAGVHGRVRMEAARAPGRGPLIRVRVQVENVTPFEEHGVSRSEALTAGCLSTHLMLLARGADFVSLNDPPARASEAVWCCDNVGMFPAVAGEPGRRDLLLSAPIALYYHPWIEPEADEVEPDEERPTRRCTSWSPVSAIRRDGHHE